MTWLAKDEPDDLYSADAWRAWRAEVSALPADVENRSDLLALADRWLADLDPSGVAGAVQPDEAKRAP
ncbi:MAG: hypothetical protein PHS60_10920 [Zavarzinia sp.]|nr:hypothetical protein [Zavarzinia sp.]